MRIERSAEADAFLATVDAADPEAVSACAGWTTHEIAAHMAGIAVEVTRHLEPYLQGDPVPATRSFEEREAPLQALTHSELLARLDAEEARMRRLVADVLDREPEAVIPWTGRHMAVAKFVPHLRNEHALHRWDVAGDDDLSGRLLGSEDLIDHSVGELGRILLVAGRKHDPDLDAEFRVRLRRAGRGRHRRTLDRHRSRGTPRLHLGPTARSTRTGPKPPVPTGSGTAASPAVRLLASLRTSTTAGPARVRAIVTRRALGRKGSPRCGRARRWRATTGCRPGPVRRRSP